MNILAFVGSSADPADGILIAGEHVTEGDGWCWCQPKMEDVLPFGSIAVHRHFWDRPEYGEDPEE